MLRDKLVVRLNEMGDAPDHQRLAAEILGISLKTLHNKLNKLRLRPKKAE